MAFNFNFDFKQFAKIVCVIREVRKGVLFMVFTTTILCFMLDWLILRHYVTDNLFLSGFRLVYVITGLVTFVLWFSKLYNNFCDNKDEQEELKQIEQQKKDYVINSISLYKPIIDCFDEKTKLLLKLFVINDSQEILFENCHWALYQRYAQQINNELLIINFIQHVTLRSGASFSVATIPPQFLDILKEYFKDWCVDVGGV